MSLEQILLEEQAKSFCHIRDTILRKFIQKRKEFKFQRAVSPVTSTTNAKTEMMALDPNDGADARRDSRTSVASRLTAEPEMKKEQLNLQSRKSRESKGAEGEATKPNTGDNMEDFCDHVRNQASFRVPLAKALENFLEQLNDQKNTRLDKRKIFLNLQNNLLQVARQRTSRALTRMAKLINQQEISSSQRRLMGLQSKDVGQYNQAVYDILTTLKKQKYKRPDSSSSESEEDEGVFAPEKQQNTSARDREIIELGNATSNMLNYSINQQLILSMKAFRKILKKQHATEEDWEKVVQQEIEKAQQLQFNSIDFRQIEDTYEVLQNQNIVQLRELKQAINEKREQMNFCMMPKKLSKEERLRERQKLLEKSRIEGIRTSFEKAIENQIHNDQGFQQDHRDEISIIDKKDVNLILQKFFKARAYFKKLKKNIKEPDNSLEMQFYKALKDTQEANRKGEQQLQNTEESDGPGEPEESVKAPPTAKHKYDEILNTNTERKVEKTLGHIEEGSLSKCVPLFTNIANGVLSLVHQRLTLQECKALGKYLEESVSDAQSDLERQNNEIKTLMIDCPNFTDEMFSVILEGILK